MIVFIASWNKGYQPIFCSEDETVEDLKLRWQENYGIHFANQRLVFAQRQLDNRYTLRQYGIRHESIVYQVAGLGRGNKPIPPDDMLECGICFEEFSKLAVLPCYHTGFCQDCVEDLDKCPLCREPL
jgi:hypothetical protein